MKSAALRRFYEATGFTVMRAAVLINIAALLGIIGLIVVNAWPALSAHSAWRWVLWSSLSRSAWPVRCTSRNTVSRPSG